MKKSILILFITLICIYNLTYAKGYVYKVDDESLELIVDEKAHLGSTFLTECDFTLSPDKYNWVEIKFLGIDSNNNIHLMRTFVQKRYKKSEEHLILKLESQKQIFIKMMFSVVKIIITPINNSSVQIKLLPNEYIKEP